jgi:hypothetical protein
VNACDVEHIESQSLFGVGVIRIYFYPGARIVAAVDPGRRGFRRSRREKVA